MNSNALFPPRVNKSEHSKVSSPESPEQTPQVLLISMPFGPLLSPSIGLGLLKAALTSRDISSKTLYFTLQFAELIGIQRYLDISNGRPSTYDLVGEWIFSASLFNDSCLDVDGYIKNILYDCSSSHRKNYSSRNRLFLEGFIQDILNIRSKAELFLEHCLQQVSNCKPQIVAFTSVFQQHTAALSLAHRIKTKHPETLIIFGGANCESIMGAEIIRLVVQKTPEVLTLYRI